MKVHIQPQLPPLDDDIALTVRKEFDRHVSEKHPEARPSSLALQVSQSE
jgi:hypothetical protein